MICRAASRSRRLARFRTTAPPIRRVAVKPTRMTSVPSSRSRACTSTAPLAQACPFAAARKSARFLKRSRGGRVTVMSPWRRCYPRKRGPRFFCRSEAVQAPLVLTTNLTNPTNARLRTSLTICAVREVREVRGQKLESPLPAGKRALGGQALAALGAAAGDDLAAVLGGRPRAEPMPALTHEAGGLIGALHENGSKDWARESGRQ